MFFSLGGYAGGVSPVLGIRGLCGNGLAKYGTWGTQTPAAPRITTITITFDQG